jgi:hypothetical protein
MPPCRSSTRDHRSHQWRRNEYDVRIVALCQPVHRFDCVGNSLAIVIIDRLGRRDDLLPLGVPCGNLSLGFFGQFPFLVHLSFLPSSNAG